ncbi:uncharacterized protein PRCAT00000137001 [Priceomyces carsonii]|uniref:uncharacterized protein n=1 Tax=Priceomyces carsonii TaxID=28549 RepID=UPI002ED7C0F4|nr:unnamed protein product [Priceomyces carsonii]
MIGHKIIVLESARYIKRYMSTQLSKLPKSSSFTDFLSPDAKIPTESAALENKDNIANTPRILSLGSFSWTLPEPRQEYVYLSSSEVALRDLGLSASEVNNEDYQKIVSGQFYLENKEKFREMGYPFPYSQAYAGWQFGQFAGQLGDGRVVNLFEVPKVSDNKMNRKIYELQLKGSGKTPYSRFADGKAVLRSSIREYIISEHLNSIGIPSTRALSLTYLPKTYAQREGAEKCAIVSRFAELWVRLGSFDLYRWRGDRKGIKDLSDYVINNLFTYGDSKFKYYEDLMKIKSDFYNESKDVIGELSDYDKMYFEIIIRNAETTAMWQCYGFLNGVLNTDNTSVLGLSMDFGPFSIMDKYDPNYTPNSEDHELRYGYRNTPTAIWWNLTRMGENVAELIGAGPKVLNTEEFDNLSLSPELQDKIIKRATKIIEGGGQIFQYAFTLKYVGTFFKRLGISNDSIDMRNPERHYEEFIEPMLGVLKKLQCDFNKFFLQIQSLNIENEQNTSESLATSFVSKIYKDDEARYLKEELIEDTAAWLDLYRNLLKDSDLAVSRASISSNRNPLFLPRNWILDEVIQYTNDSNGEDLSYLKKLERMSLYPYDKSKWGDDLKELEERWLVQGDVDEYHSMLQCSCSS